MVAAASHFCPGVVCEATIVHGRHISGTQMLSILDGQSPFLWVQTYQIFQNHSRLGSRGNKNGLGSRSVSVRHCARKCLHGPENMGK